MRQLQTDLSIFAGSSSNTRRWGEVPVQTARTASPSSTRRRPCARWSGIAQRRGTPFYITKDEENCFGTIVLGMQDAPLFAEAGLLGEKYEIFQEPRANERMYQHVPTLASGVVNYAAFWRSTP